jgi:hypothetical protein
MKKERKSTPKKSRSSPILNQPDQNQRRSAEKEIIDTEKKRAASRAARPDPIDTWIAFSPREP